MGYFFKIILVIFKNIFKIFVYSITLLYDNFFSKLFILLLFLYFQYFLYKCQIKIVKKYCY